ncbi:MAG: MTH1187 family thiamine-binding protein [Desulfobacterales bacterium]|jgi:uncharacterized protein (TIGR00106 family)|nr:MTH1187 family thiamine-binding protein [Desulfobacterales bacterium]MDP6683636.1 MTH1187 family thiamine-binding protein [Desulfobacterales bacterium]MDP6807841.1 MTH1187 family thiamine-binding protein [Desulfobacterales bacterium]|tara:strand:- start:192 stop:485 length:294 start_codon:yes stop_codon:yes gene_type:complete
MSTIVDFTISPLDKGESLSPYVARVVSIIKTSGLSYKLGPMGTSIEGEMDEIMSLIQRCFEELKRDCGRILMTIKADYRKDFSGRIKTKVSAVEDKI